MSTASQDVVGVFDASLNQMFQTARPMRATVLVKSRLMDHPMESGATVSDHKIFDPDEVTLYMLLGNGEYKQIYQQIKTAYKSSQLLTVQTMADTFQDMSILEMPHDETPDMADAIMMQLKLRKVMLVTAQFQALPPRKVAKPNDASTKDRGEQTATKSSKLNNVFGGLFK